MTKSTLHKKKILPLTIVLTLVILGIFNLNSVSAISWSGDGALFIPDDDHPTQYGVFIPQPNMYSTISVDASNQGRYAMMNWNGAETSLQGLVDYPGVDISEFYPWYLDYFMASTTNDDYINPWVIDWINVTTMNPHDISLSNYTINSVFNYYVLTENSKLNIPFNSTIPIQIDLMIDSVGPKVIKLDWLTEEDPSMVNPLGFASIICPSGRQVYGYPDTATYKDSMGFFYDRELFDFITFVAHEKGAYRLLLLAQYSKPAHLSMEFLDTPISTLALDSLEFGGNGDESPTLVEILETKWQNKWYRINGEEGDLFRLDLGIDHEGDVPLICSWMPCENGYILQHDIGVGVFDLYFPTTGTGYISFIDNDHGDAYRYSLYLEEFEISNYTIGYKDLYTTKISRDQRKAIEFEVEQDSFVEFNYTLFDQPAGDPRIYADGTDYSFLYEDSKKLSCYEIISPVDMKTVGEETFYYYYMPSGTYKALLRNNDVQYEGVVQISSKYVDFINNTIPITSLTYPDTDPSQFLTIGFDADEYYNGIYEAQYVYIDITEPGQYFLNATIYASDHLAGLPLEANPSLVFVYNSSEDTYHDFTEQALDPSKNFSAFSDDGGVEGNDILYIAYTSKWHDMHFNFSIPGTGAGLDIDFHTWNGIAQGWDYVTEDDDYTNDFTQNGTINLRLTDGDYLDWVPGADFDLLDIDESQYYWLSIDLDPGDDYTQIPYIQTLKLSNITMGGELNLALVGESGYEYCNFWNPYIDTEMEDLLINQEFENFNDSDTAGLFTNSAPGMIGLEEGRYKLLIIPYGWGSQVPLQIDFGIGNWYSYRHEQMYNITEEPNLYPYQIRRYNASWYGYNNITTYGYGLTTSYNDTEGSIGGGAGASYFVLDCYGDSYMWTQLVVSTNNVSDYNLYLMQDLPWIDNSGPFQEIMGISPTSLNETYEFGVLTDHFYLIFEVNAFDETVTFRVDLTQYDTTILTTSVPIGTYKAPTPGLSGPLVLGLAIGIPVAAGVIVVIYILKKKGRIGSKTP